jgi:protein SCO1/2
MDWIVMLKKLVLMIFCYCCLGVGWASSLPILSGVGGDFSAVDQNNLPMKLSDYKDKVIVLAFGYTNCADICPFTLGYLKGLYEELSNSEKKNILILFVTVDPQYDTPDHLKEFITYFNKNFIGITGTKSQVDNIVELFQAEYHTLSNTAIETKDMRRVNPKIDVDIKKDKALLYTHSVTIYLMDKELRVRSLEYTGTPREEFANKIRQLIDE